MGALIDWLIVLHSREVRPKMIAHSQSRRLPTRSHWPIGLRLGNKEFGTSKTHPWHPWVKIPTDPSCKKEDQSAPAEPPAVLYLQYVRIEEHGAPENRA